MITLKLRKIGNSYGFTIPKELKERYRLNEGEEVHVIQNENDFTITPFDPEFKEWVKDFDRTNQKYKNALKELAEWKI